MISSECAHAERTRLRFPSTSGRLAAIVFLGLLARSAEAQLPCYAVYVAPASSLQTVYINQTFTLTAVVTNSLNTKPRMGGGTVTFLDNGSPLPGGTVPVDQNGNASFVTTLGAAGAHVITGVSSWRICNTPSTSSSVSITVLSAPLSQTPIPGTLILALSGITLMAWIFRKNLILG